MNAYLVRFRGTGNGEVVAGRSSKDAKLNVVRKHGLGDGNSFNYPRLLGFLAASRTLYPVGHIEGAGISEGRQT